MRTFMIAALAAALGFPAAGAWAQSFSGYPIPSAAECRVIIADISSPVGSEAWERSYNHPRVHTCGAAGAAALAAVLPTIADIQDPDIVERMQFPFLQVRHPVLMRAALAVLSDTTAPPLSRLFAMLVSMSQIDNNILLYGPLSRYFVPVGRFCGPSVYWGEPWVYAARMPRGFRQEIAAALRRVGENPAEAQAMRDAARCALEGVDLSLRPR